MGKGLHLDGERPSIPWGLRTLPPTTPNPSLHPPGPLCLRCSLFLSLLLEIRGLEPLFLPFSHPRRHPVQWQAQSCPFRGRVERVLSSGLGSRRCWRGARLWRVQLTHPGSPRLPATAHHHGRRHLPRAALAQGMLRVRGLREAAVWAALHVQGRVRLLPRLLLRSARQEVCRVHPPHQW